MTNPATSPAPEGPAAYVTPPDTYVCTCDGGEGHASTCDMWKQFKLDEARRAVPVPEGDAPTAEMVAKALQALRENAERYGWTAFSDEQQGYYGRSLAWLTSRLPSLLAADADRQRMDWLTAQSYDGTIDVELRSFLGRRIIIPATRESIDKWRQREADALESKRAARSSSPTSERPEGDTPNG